ncbi:MAG: SUMF1/EgtB/PvdO family nonheme iron enzyme [Caldilineaceae bacterium]
MTDQTFEQTLKAHLRSANLSQARAARRLGYAPDTFNKWVRGVNRMPDDVINQLGKLLKLSPAQTVALLRLAGYTIPLTHGVDSAPTDQPAPTSQGIAADNLPYRPYIQAIRHRFSRWADLPVDAGPLYPLADADPAAHEGAQDAFLALQALPLPMRVAEFRPKFEQEARQPENLISALLENPRNVILGAPGSGKSSALERLTWLLADDALRLSAGPLQSTQSSVPLPIFVRLADYAGEPDLIPLLRRSIVQTGGVTVMDEAVQSCLRDPKIQPVLLLDGLNELDRDVAEQGIRVVRRHWVDYPHHRIYLTCRVADFDAHLMMPRALPTDFRVWEIHPLLDNIKNWEDPTGVSDVRHYLRAHIGEAAGRRLYNRLKRDERLHSLTQLPLFLWMVKELGGYDGELPHDRGSLIRQFVRARRLLGIIPKPLRLAAEYSLEAIGFAMHKKGVLELDEWQVYDLLAEVRGVRSYDLDAMWSWLQRTGLLQEPEHASVRMLHQLVQEYSAAAYLVRQADCLERLIALAGDSWWREVVILALWLRPDLHTPAFLQMLMHNVAVDLWVRAEAGAILAQVGDPRFSVRQSAWRPDADSPARQVLFIQPPLCRVPAGEALLGSDAKDAFDTETPLCRVDVVDFAIGLYPVTNAEYGCFLAAGGYADERWWLPDGRAWLRGERNVDAATEAAFIHFYNQLSSGVEELIGRWRAHGELIPETDAKHYRWLASLSQEEYMIARADVFVRPRKAPAFWRDGAYSLPDAPVVGVNWYEAMAYTTWLAAITGDRYRLPTEAEWEWAAQRRRPTDPLRLYPWGDTWDAQRCNGSDTHFGRTCTVGIFPHGATPDGIHDLAGNVYEWTSTLFRPYPYNTNDGREELLAAGARVSRGGAWPAGAQHNRCTLRNHPPPLFNNERTGFRLARD